MNGADVQCTPEKTIRSSSSTSSNHIVARKRCSLKDESDLAVPPSFVILMAEFKGELSSFAMEAGIIKY